MSVNELTMEAKTENLSKALAFIDERLEELGCSMKAQMQIDVAMEELFVNVAQYAYKGLEKLRSSQKLSEMVTIRIEDKEEPKRIVFTLTDEGTPFNPLLQKDPDTSLPAEKRRIGGLGIFLAKKNMDGMEYEYKDGKNILTIQKFM